MINEGREFLENLKRTKGYTKPWEREKWKKKFDVAKSEYYLERKTQNELPGWELSFKIMKNRES